MWSVCLYGGPHKIKILGDLIVKQGTEAEYTVTVKNVSEKDFADLIINVEGFNGTGLMYDEATSENMKMISYEMDDGTGVEAYLDRLPVNQTASVTIKIRACALKNDGDLRSQWLTVKADGSNFRRGVIKRSVTIYKI